MKKTMTILIALVALVAAFAIPTTASAAAKKGPNGCSYTHKPSSNQCEGQVGHKSPIDTSFTNPFLSLALPNVSVAGAESVAQANVTILSFVKARGLTKKQKSKMKCRYVPAGTGYWNSAMQADGSLRWFWDTRAGTICTDKHGRQYRAECGNRVRKNMPPNVVQGEIRLVRTFGSFKVSATVSEKVRVEGVCGFAEASAEASAWARGYTRVQARGNAQIIASGKAQAQAYAKAIAAIHCAPITPPPPPPPPCEETGTCPYPPIGEIDASAAHVQTGNRRVQLYFIGDDPNGDNIVLDILLDAPAGTYISGKTKVTQFSDPNRTCPSDQTCWEATLWSGNTPGDAWVSGKFTAGGESFTTEPVKIVVAPDQFPD